MPLSAVLELGRSQMVQDSVTNDNGNGNTDSQAELIHQNSDVVLRESSS
jgi:hypothetical protein